MTQQLGSGVNPAALIDQAHGLLAEAITTYRQPEAYSKLARFIVDQASIDWGTVWGTGIEPSEGTAQVPDVPFPVLLRNVEQLSRQINVLQTLLVGFASTAYYSDIERAEIFGMPAGKTAFRNIAEFLRDSLGITLRDAKSRVKLAGHLSPAPSLDGGHRPDSPYPEVAKRFLEASIDASAAEIVVDTINQVEREAAQAKVLTPEVEQQLVAGQDHLAKQADALDPDGLRQVAKRWSQYTTHWFEQNHPPDDEVLDRKRGAFYRGEVQGLHSWMLRVDSLFHERLRVLAAVVNNPNATFEPLKSLLEKLFGTALPNFSSPVGHKPPAENGQQELLSEDEVGTPIAAADDRNRQQKLLDGLTAVFDTGMSLASTTLPTMGGLPPQLSVVMDYQTLYDQLSHDCNIQGPSQPTATNFISQALFTGPISPSSIRPLSCEADLIPAVLGSQGAILDMGRKTRLFTTDQRRALIARDRGCAAPNCTIPAPWCDAHHVEAWKRGGPTSVVNATLLCSHHHHAVHAGMWQVTMNAGIPWFTPAPYLDPDQRPRRNRFWR
ncbi:HNH endonuclease signature motif containing protein [Yaniella halotolerans]|uniref:HNH endonuclease signature motif containing protein n=1 Tax=Yaniella halotolerans TaxID=225453 RepID=UPI0003B44976|nr:HNH endonuclease signature motif containing protein [Yaniella halotolerans]